jgi:hypothetical protein
MEFADHIRQMSGVMKSEENLDSHPALKRIKERLKKLPPREAARELTDTLLQMAQYMREYDLTMKEMLEDCEEAAHRVEHEAAYRRRVVENCRDQPAGTPVILDDYWLRIVFAPGYADKRTKRVRQSSRRQREKWDEQRRERQRVARLQWLKDDPQKNRYYCLAEYYLGGDHAKNGWYERRIFWSDRLNTYIGIWENRETRKVKLKIYRQEDKTSYKLDLYTNTCTAAAAAYDLAAEQKAMDKLRGHLTEAQFKCYFSTGTFYEKSKRTGLTYIFRRCRPTLVYRDGKECRNFIAALCVHPQGYYSGSWAGTLVPSDDIITHVMMMRADEAKYWRISTQHSRHSPQADI